LRWIVGLAAAAVTMAAIVLGVALAVAYPQLPDISSLTDYQPKLPLRVLTSDGVLIGEFGEERRQFTPIKEIPKVMQQAVLAIEDTQFYEHGGVDFKGMLRALKAQLSEARSQGASTITMQLARNFYLSSEKSYTRKIYEVLLAYKIESQLSKEQILEVYMNQIYLGQRAYGFGAASEIYFGKPLKDVSIAEAAMLAGLPKAPSRYNPIVNPKRATVRQQYIIERLHETGAISVAQMQAAKADVLRYRSSTDVSPNAEYIAEAVRLLMVQQFGDTAYVRGLNVVTTVNSQDQLVAFRALRRGVMDFEMRQLYRGPEAFMNLPKEAAAAEAKAIEALDDHPDDDELIAAMVMEASATRVVVLRASGEKLTITGNGLKPVQSGLASNAPAAKQIRRGSVVRLFPIGKNTYALTHAPEVEGALVSVEPNTGNIRAFVGGFDFSKNKFNRVTQAWRQPGSSFKPFIYSAALERGFTATSVIADTPLFFDAAQTGSQPWEPKNYDGTFDGPMSLRKGLARSKNMVSIRVLDRVGAPFAQSWSTKFGFDAERHPPVLTLALGAGTVTPLQMASGINVFATGGHYVPPRLIAKVLDRQGRIVSEPAPVVLDESNRAIPARNAYVMTSLLQEVTTTGTAANASRALKRRDLYGKTGTTNDSLDAWFAGWQPSLAAVVWIGYDTPRKLGDKETGGGLALPVWIEYMQHALKSIPVKPMGPPPDGLVSVGSEYVFKEFAGGAGIDMVGVEEEPPAPPSEAEKSSILDLFRR
jgi:penicillin-binding protein 1A